MKKRGKWFIYKLRFCNWMWNRLLGYTPEEVQKERQAPTIPDTRDILNINGTWYKAKVVKVDKRIEYLPNHIKHPTLEQEAHIQREMLFEFASQMYKDGMLQFIDVAEMPTLKDNTYFMPAGRKKILIGHALMPQIPVTVVKTKEELGEVLRDF